MQMSLLVVACRAIEIVEQAANENKPLVLMGTSDTFSVCPICGTKGSVFNMRLLGKGFVELDYHVCTHCTLAFGFTREVLK